MVQATHYSEIGLHSYLKLLEGSLEKEGGINILASVIVLHSASNQI